MPCRDGRLGGRNGTAALFLVSLVLACTSKPSEVEPDAKPMTLPAEGMRLTDDGATRRAPVSLTASDGTGLKLVSLKARGTVEEPLAFTELHMVFENPNDRQIEGRFEIDMPPNAAISRFAMKIQDRWQEGEVVERQAARVAYEDFLHRKQDPALLENEAGNSFSARVFPIAPRERKELIVSYSQELPSSAEPYRLMLRGLPELDELDASVILRQPGETSTATRFDAVAVETSVIEVKKQNYMPDRDLEVRSDRTPMVMGVRHDNLAVARVAPVGEMSPVPMGALTVLFDTSASRALAFDRQIRRLEAVLKSIHDRTGDDFALRVVCFDQATELVYAGSVSGFGPAQLERIASRRALGASDLAGALKAVAARPDGSQRLLVFSDGIITAGSTEHADLRAATRSLATAGFERADAIVDGGIQDATTLAALTTADLPSDGVVMDARLPLETIAHKLGSATLPAMKVSVAGAAWVWPDTIEGAQPGDQLLVYADLPADAAMHVVIEGEHRIEAEVPTTAVERPLLERAWVRAQIDRLQAQRSSLPETDETARARLQSTIVDLSTKYRVLSDFTALLVLETEWDYQRFNIDRSALADILTVGATGVELYNRTSAPPTQPDESPEVAAMNDPTSVIPQMARSFDPDTTQAGTFGLLAPNSGHFLASPYGGAFAVGHDEEDVWGASSGSEVGEAFGVGGLGLVGTGRGGGGTGEGTIGLGNVGLIGSGGSGGTGSGYGRGAGAGFGGRGRRVPRVRQAKAEVRGALDRDIIRRIVRAHINEVRYCYNQTLARDPSARGRLAIRFVINRRGKVELSEVGESSVRDANLGRCVARAVRRWTFPKPQGGGLVTVTYPFIFDSDQASSDVRPSRPPTPEEVAQIAADGAAWRAATLEMEAREKIREAQRRAIEAEEKRTEGSPYTGKFFDVAARLQQSDGRGAMALALEWHEQDPGDVLALIALGEAAETTGDGMTAARAYGSIIDLFPSRADLRRYVGARLERLGEPGTELAVDTFAKAVRSRPDHPSSHRLYAYALLKAGKHGEAFAAIGAGATRSYPSGRFAGVDRILREDLGLIAAAWIKAEPQAAFTVRATLDRLDVPLPNEPSTRFVINWETDANDVDFHVHDGRENHAFYSQPRLSSGGKLYADVTTGYGPECFTIEGEPKAFPYRLAAHYFSRGPMGYGMGKLQIVQHDGKGELRFEERPFVIMKDRAFVDLGELTEPL
jgi:TonB family protein